MEFAHDPRYAELLAEPLTDEEVRDLLERLGSKEFGGPEHATVGAVVEATGSSVETVGNLLAEIRHEDFQERFGLRLDHHEKRIETLEERARRLERTPARVQVKYAPIDEEHQRVIDAYEEKKRNRVPALFALIIIVIFLLLLSTTNRNPSPDGSITITDVNGRKQVLVGEEAERYRALIEESVRSSAPRED